jgi:hypothetical protein
MSKKTTKEIFKDIPFNLNYQVSNLGRVKNINTGKILNYNKISTGYLKVDLYHLGVRRACAIHRLVLIAFLGEKKGLIVNHKDGRKMNNQLDNLEWVTHSENILHAFRMGLIIPRTKKVSLFKDGVYKNTFNSVKDASEHLGISNSWGSSICRNGKIYKGFKLVFAS